MTDSRTASALNEARKVAGELMDEYFEKNYPLSDETYEEFVRLSDKYVQATEVWMKACAPRWRA